MYRSRRHPLRQDVPYACDVPGLLLAAGGIQHTSSGKSHTTASEATAHLERLGKPLDPSVASRYNTAAICSHFRHLWRPLLVLYVMLPASHGGSLWPAQNLSRRRIPPPRSWGSPLPCRPCVPSSVSLLPSTRWAMPRPPPCCCTAKRAPARAWWRRSYMPVGHAPAVALWGVNCAAMPETL